MQPTLATDPNHVPDTMHSSNTFKCSLRNRDRNPRPCGNCSISKVRCLVSKPYSSLLCKRCEEDGLSSCVPRVPRIKTLRGPCTEYEEEKGWVILIDRSNDLFSRASTEIAVTTETKVYTQDLSNEKDISVGGELHTKTLEAAAQNEDPPVCADQGNSSTLPINGVESAVNSIETTSCEWANTSETLYNDNSVATEDDAVAQNESYHATSQPCFPETGVNWFDFLDQALNDVSKGIGIR
ncbi:hypothetical protein BD410DRAFT_808455 [Rickenella mellea]|uniref:Zn(2)-C6 fungal-type domain-containing protein n=1 Tax=Rickenella mellea TaxID=50990 RepID=A0A4Y7PLU0_9AGAM|nr:hypothetical protein BD410DRAFT_808455 [Rickenella mellea]